MIIIQIEQHNLHINTIELCQRFEDCQKSVIDYIKKFYVQDKIEINKEMDKLNRKAFNWG